MRLLLAGFGAPITHEKVAIRAYYQPGTWSGIFALPLQEDYFDCIPSISAFKQCYT
jgi:hypothetical protein